MIKEKIIKKEENKKDFLAEWEMKKCLSVSRQEEVYFVKNIYSEENCILKIMNKKDYAERKYNQVKKLSDSCFVLPEKRQKEEDKIYVFYPWQTPLKEVLCENGLSFCDILSMGTDLADAMIEMRQKGIYESDISPNNIYMNREGRFCLGDLNLQKCRCPGTKEYTAPEYAKSGNEQGDFGNKKADRRKKMFDAAMQYSVCKLCYCMLERQDSFLTREVENCLKKGMAHQVEERYSSLEELKSRLESIIEGYEPDEEYLLLRLKREDKLFQCRTSSVQNQRGLLKNTSYFYPVLWSGMLVMGFFCLIFFYQSMKKKTEAFQREGYYSQIATSEEESVENSRVAEETEKADEVIQDDEIEIDVRKNGLTSIEEIMNRRADWDSVLCIYAGENQITSTEKIRNFANLKEIYLNNNGLKQLVDIEKCKELEVLVLSYNQLRKIPQIRELTNLKYLDLASNKDFEDSATLEGMTKLETLNISGTNISEKKVQQLQRKLPNCNIIW